MLTLALYGLLAVGIAAVLFVIAAYVLPAGERIAPPIRDEPLWDLPASQRLLADDVVHVRLPVALRGYRFAETDLLLDRLADELKSRDDEIAQLRASGTTSWQGTEPVRAESDDDNTDQPQEGGRRSPGEHDASAQDDDD